MVDGLRERLEDWDRRSVEDGLAGLATLADEEFDGVVTAGPVTATFVSGRVLHCDGDLESLEDRSLTVRVAPSPELALLVAMNATGGETQAQYYTEDTDLESVDERLQSGGFTGYIELAENVLSGSYYRLYYGGTARSLAFVGTNDRVLTGAEAFDRTLDEVGIYEVVPVDLSVTEIPDPPEPAGGSAVEDSSTGVDDPSAGTVETDAADVSPLEDSVDDGEPPDSGDLRATGASGGTPSGTDTTEVATADDTASEDDATPTADSTTDADEDGDATVTDDDAATATDDATVQDAAGSEPVADATTGTTDGTETTQSAQGDAGQSDRRSDVATEAATATTTEEPVSGDAGGASDSDGDDTRSVSETPGDDVGGDQSEHRQQTRSADERIEELVERVAALERRFQTFQTENESTSPTTSDGDSTGAASNDRSPADVLEDTDCLVRYETRAGATIEELLDGEATTDAVRENLRIETNTTFDADATTVDGVPFGAFLEGSLERRVVAWLMCDLPTEIVATDSRGALGDLVEALPAIDRIGFQETVDLEALGEEPLDEESPDSVGFDLVAWDTDGQPRVVADLRRSTDPIGEGPVSSLIARGKAVANRTDLATALFATDGYFDADARRAVEATTGGGILARDSRTSYVKMTRKRGFHCCLAEAYDEAIHLTVPEL